MVVKICHFDASAWPTVALVAALSFTSGFTEWIANEFANTYEITMEMQEIQHTLHHDYIAITLKLHYSYGTVMDLVGVVNHAL